LDSERDKQKQQEARELNAKKATENSVQGFLLTIGLWGFIAFLVFLVLAVVTNGFEGPGPDLGTDTLPPNP
jgi:hypothetical protein